jgi:putative ABC transport system permease protein
MKLDFQEIDVVARIASEGAAFRTERAEANERFYWADPGFFDIIEFPVVAGSLKDALKQPDAAVLTRSMALKYLGSDTALGGTLQVDGASNFRVTAIIENIPSNSQFGGEIFLSSKSNRSNLSQIALLPPDKQRRFFVADTYFRLKDGFSIESLQERLEEFSERRLRDATSSNSQLSLRLVPLGKVHLDPARLNVAGGLRPPGDVNAIYSIMAIGGLIVLVVGFNFSNLMAARASQRATEVGVRKVSGASRWHLVSQFVSESTIIVAISAVLAACLARLALPEFANFLQRNVTLSYSRLGFIVVGLAGTSAFIGIVAGLYPALALAGLRPSAVLKRTMSKTFGSELARTAVIVVQFAVLIGLLISTVTIYRQTAYATGQGLRIRDDNTLVISGEKACDEAFVDRLQSTEGVRDVACALYMPINQGSTDVATFRPDGTRVDLRLDVVGFGFFEFYGLHPIAGRLFSAQFQSDNAANIVQPAEAQPPVIINETAARALGFRNVQQAIGQSVSWSRVVSFKEAKKTPVLPSEIIGVIPDFPMGSIRREVPPALYFVDSSLTRLLSVRLASENLPQTVTAVDALWKRYGDGKPIQRRFLEQYVQNLYIDVLRQAQMFGAFSAITVLVACLGLFGLAAHTAQQRTKEIGLRKALGANTRDVLRLLIWQFTKPVLWATILAWPVIAFLLNWWLSGFAYHIDQNPVIYIGAAAAALLIAIVTVWAHTINAARTEPAVALKDE